MKAEPAELTNMTPIKLILVATLISLSTQVQAQSCLSGLPDTLRVTVEQDHWKIVSPFDLPSDDWKLWKNAHQGQCPGVAVGNFYPRTDSSYIVALIQGDDQKHFLEEVLLVTTRRGQTITEVVVSPVQTTTPAVVWKLIPGHYAGIDGKKASISRDSFVYEKIASSATQFYYQGSNLKSFPISN